MRQTVTQYAIIQPQLRQNPGTQIDQEDVG